jgi:hypothetical protein
MPIQGLQCLSATTTATTTTATLFHMLMQPTLCHQLAKPKASMPKIHTHKIKSRKSCEETCQTSQCTQFVLQLDSVRRAVARDFQYDTVPCSVLKLPAVCSKLCVATVTAAVGLQAIAQRP